MAKGTLESLPNEILLTIFGYLSSFDLCRAFLDVENSRIDHLLTYVRHSLDVSTMHYEQLCRFLSSSNDSITNRFTASIETVVIRHSFASHMLVNHWKKMLNNDESLNLWLPSIKRLILNGNHHQYGFVESLLVPLVFSNNTLQHLHLVFKRPTDAYSSILAQLVLHRISVHTMILEVQKGHEFHPIRPVESLHDIQPVCWPNTIRLTLSIQHSSEFMLLLKRDSLPVIEHLNVTNEQVHTASALRRDKPVIGVRLCEHRLRQIGDANRLRSLLIRYITLGDAVTLLGSLTMLSLEKLILIDLFDDTLDHVGKFQELCDSGHLPALKNLHFSFCFPKELEHSWRISSFGCNNERPYDNIDCYIDESWIPFDDGCDFITKTFFIVYKHPIATILQHKRSLHNHRFAAHASVPIATNRRRSMEWTCDRTDEPDQLLKTLQIIASNRVDKLHVTYLDQRTNVTVLSIYPSERRLLLHCLRSINFRFNTGSITRSQRVIIVKQILDASPNLSHLVVEWKEFCCCSQIYPNLKYLQLVLDRLYPEPEEHFNIDHLTQLVPHLCHLETSGANIMFNENLVEFVLKIIRAFHQLVYIMLNKDSLYHSKVGKKIMFKESLIKSGHGRLFDCNNILIQYHMCDLLCIWL